MGGDFSRVGHSASSSKQLRVVWRNKGQRPKDNFSNTDNDIMFQKVPYKLLDFAGLALWAKWAIASLLEGAQGIVSIASAVVGLVILFIGAIRKWDQRNHNKKVEAAKLIKIEQEANTAKRLNELIEGKDLTINEIVDVMEVLKGQKDVG